MTDASAKGHDGEGADPAASLVRGDLLFRLQRAIGLIPAAGLGVGRRAVALALLTWVPIVAWAALAGRALPGAQAAEPLLQHFGVTVRCLVAIPLFVLAEGMAHGVSTRLVPHFVRSGLVQKADRPRFEAIVRGVARLRDATLPWVVIAGLLLAWLALAPRGGVHEVTWAEMGEGRPDVGFGGHWFLWVVRPVFLALLLAWVWRLALAFVLMRRIARLDLALVPTHPDRAGGLGFLEWLPGAFALVALGISAVVAAHWAHDVLYHGVSVTSLRTPGIALVALLVALFLAPVLPFAGPLRAAKRRALLDYGALVGRHGRDVRRRWILDEPIEDEALLAAPEVGPVADAIALYEAVSKMRTFPVGRGALLAIALPALLPLIAVYAIEVPLRQILAKLVGTLL